MITKEQQIWLDHLSNVSKIKIVSHDPTCEEKFQFIKQVIQNHLGHKQSVEHCGASRLGISGQDEIDVYVPVSANTFDETVCAIIHLFGDPKSNYPLKRARFVTKVDDKHIDVFVINSEDDGWKDLVIFQSYVLSHPNALEDYRLLKEKSAGLSTREYYRRKIELINEILVQAKEK